MRFNTKFHKLPAALFVAAMAMGMSPAAAQTEAASAQISGQVHKITDGSQSPLGKGDEEFSQLFQSWQSLDDGSGVVGEARRPAMSIPSRMPLGKMMLTSDYGMRNHPVLGRRSQHKGVDLAASTGTPVYATADGVVARANRFGSYGNYIQIEHGGELQTRFAHLSGFAVKSGDRVKKGDLIGYVGSTGRSTGPHLHYEVRLSGEAVNPIPYMRGEMTGERLAVSQEAGGQGGPE